MNYRSNKTYRASRPYRGTPLTLTTGHARLSVKHAQTGRQTTTLAGKNVSKLSGC